MHVKVDILALVSHWLQLDRAYW